MREAQARADRIRDMRPGFYVAVVKTAEEADALAPYLEPLSIIVVASDADHVLVRNVAIEEDDRVIKAAAPMPLQALPESTDRTG